MASSPKVFKLLFGARFSTTNTMASAPQPPPAQPPRRLYWMSGAPSSWRVLLALELKQLPYESVRMEMSKGDMKTPEYMAMNPRGQAPLLIDYEKGGGTPIYESFAILMFLEKHYRNIPLLSSSSSAEPGAYGLEITRTCECENVHRKMIGAYRTLSKVDSDRALGAQCRAMIEAKRACMSQELAM